MQYDIIFEWTERSIYSAQGAGPIGEAGYNVWIQYTDSEFIDFLGFVPQNQLYDEVEYYKSLGITPKMRMSM